MHHEDASWITTAEHTMALDDLVRNSGALCNSIVKEVTTISTLRNLISTTCFAQEMCDAMNSKFVTDELNNYGQNTLSQTWPQLQKPMTFNCTRNTKSQCVA